MKKLLCSMVLVIALAIGAMSGEAYARGDGKLSAGQHMLGASFGLKVLILPHFSLNYDYVVKSGLFKSGKASWTVGGYFGMTGLKWFHFNLRTALRWQLARSFELYLNLQSGMGLLLVKTTVPVPVEPVKKSSSSWPSLPQVESKVVTKTVTTATYHFEVDYALGMRYNFTDHVGMHCELSSGVALPFFSLPYLSLGVSYRL